MELLKFKELPTLESMPLPFEPDEAHLQLWLDSLSCFADEIAAEQLLRVIHQIANLKQPGTLQLGLLQRLLEYWHGKVESMQNIYLAANQPFDEYITHHLELVVWNYFLLAQSLMHNIQKNLLTLTAEQQALGLYLGLDALNNVLLHISIGYRSPMPGFWSLSYQIYRHAENQQLLNRKVNQRGYRSKYLNPRQQVTIEQLFKQLLIFYLADPQQFNCPDMLTIFKILLPFSPQAGIIGGYQPEWQQGVCEFNLAQDHPPRRILDNELRMEASIRVVAPVAVAKSLYQALQDRSLPEALSDNHNVILRAINALGLSRKRKYLRTRPKRSETEFKGIVGFVDLIKYLQFKTPIMTGNSKASLSGKQRPLEKFKPMSLELMPVAEDAGVHLRSTTPKPTHQGDVLTPIQRTLMLYQNSSGQREPMDMTPSRESEQPELYLETFEVDDISIKGYGLLTKWATVHAKIGDTLAIIRDHERTVELGIIRRINHVPGERLHIGVEILSFKAELVYVSNVSDYAWAIYIPAVEILKQPETLICESLPFKATSVIDLQRHNDKREYRLIKQVQITHKLTQMMIQPV